MKCPHCNSPSQLDIASADNKTIEVTNMQSNKKAVGDNNCLENILDRKAAKPSIRNENQLSGKTDKRQKTRSKKMSKNLTTEQKMPMPSDILAFSAPIKTIKEQENV